MSEKETHQPTREQWHQSIPFLVVAFFIIGPFVIPILWFNKKISISLKILFTVALLLLSYLLYMVSTELFDLTNERVEALKKIRQDF